LDWINKNKAMPTTEAFKRDTNFTVWPELSPEAANYVAAQTNALRNEFGGHRVVASALGGRDTTSGAVVDNTTPLPDAETLIKAYSSLGQGPVQITVMVDRVTTTEEFLLINELDFEGQKGHLVPLNVSSAGHRWERCLAAFLSLFAGRISENKKISCQASLPSIGYSKKASGAPKWLIQRMEMLRKLPPPTLEEVETSFRAAEATRRKYEGNLTSFAAGQRKLVI
jgi:hypothetical protein